MNSTQPQGKSTMVTNAVIVPTNVFTSVVSVVAPQADRILYVQGYGASPDNNTVIGVTFDYAIRLIVGAATAHRQIVRGDIGGWQALVFDSHAVGTGSGSISVQVLHNQVTDQPFMGFVQVQER